MAGEDGFSSDEPTVSKQWQDRYGNVGYVCAFLAVVLWSWLGIVGAVVGLGAAAHGMMFKYPQMARTGLFVIVVNGLAIPIGTYFSLLRGV